MYSASRVRWVDLAKGLSIILVVNMHTTLGLERALEVTTAAGAFVEYVRTFRMPLFFVVAGLFLSRSIDKNWSEYLDKKVLHFAYFYVLWLTLQFAVKGAQLYHGDPLELVRLYILSFVEPFGTLWFIYILPIFFVVTKLLKDTNKWLLWAAAACLCAAPISTGWMVVDEFASRFVFFLTGYMAAPKLFSWADKARANPALAIATLLAFLTINYVAFIYHLSPIPGVELGLGLLGAGAMIGAVSLLSNTRWSEPLRVCGQHSLYIYLSFFLPMVAMRILLLKLDPYIGFDPNVMAVAITTVSVVTPLIFYNLAINLGAGFLFVRPNWAHLAHNRKKADEHISAPQL